MAITMVIEIDPAIWERYPHLKIGVLVARGVNNQVQNEDILKLLRKSEHETKNKYAQPDLGNIEKITDWREAYRSFGYKPSSTRSSSEALLRRALKDKPLPDINPIVNLYNSISLKHTLSAGADDLDAAKGNIRLQFAKGDETFIPLGGGEPELAMAGEVIYCDGEAITCKAWNWRECDRTKITHETKNAAIVIEGLEHTSLGEMSHALKELKELIERFCGGTFELYLLDAVIPTIGKEAQVEKRSIPIEIPEPEYHKHEAYQTRKAKLEEILALGVDPYPHKYDPTHSVHDLIAKYGTEKLATFEEAQEGTSDHARIAGRLVLFRPMGTNIFGQLLDETHTLQVLFNRYHTKVNGLNGEHAPLKFIEKKLDLGDIIGVDGHLFRTQKGELTLFAKEVTLLCKTLLPLPDKHKGIADKGTRYRKRWLDLISNPEVSEQLRLRSRLFALIRKYCEEYGFLEVETPTLQNIYLSRRVVLSIVKRCEPTKK